MAKEAIERAVEMTADQIIQTLLPAAEQTPAKEPEAAQAGGKKEEAAAAGETATTATGTDEKASGEKASGEAEKEKTDQAGDGKDAGEARKAEEPRSEAEPPKPGTPDKALQRLQQDQAATSRLLEKLMQKLEDGGTLSAKEQQQVQQSRRKLDAIREAMKASGFDVVDQGEALAGSLIETDEDVQAIKARLAQLEQRLEERTAGDSWAGLKEQYAGVDVQGVWEKAVNEAVEVLGEENPAVRKLASKLFHERADAAAKSVKAKETRPPGAAQPAAKKPPITPGAAQVSSASGAGAMAGETLSAEEEYRRAALALVRDDN